MFWRLSWPFQNIFRYKLYKQVVWSYNAYNEFFEKWELFFLVSSSGAVKIR